MRAAPVGQRLTVERAVINPLATQGRAALSQVAKRCCDANIGGFKMEGGT